MLPWLLILVEASEQLEELKAGWVFMDEVNQLTDGIDEESNIFHYKAA